MMLAWHWPWAALAGVLATLAIIVLIVVFARRNAADDTPVFSMDDDLNTEHASRLFRQWRALGRLAISVLVLALALAIVLVARPSQVDAGDERASSRDIVLCLDVSGSTLPYDREVIDTYLELVKHFKGERIGLSIFNSTSRTVFPLTDDYELVTKQLTSASKALKGVESQDDIDKMSDAEYQDIANWLEGTQNRKDATSLIGDGVVSCAAMLPGFAYGEANHANADRQRAASIVLATDNVVSGKPTYSLTEALDLTQQTKITVDGLYSGPKASESDQTTTDMKSAIESHGGIFLTQSNGASIDELVRDIQSRRGYGCGEQGEILNGGRSRSVDACSGRDTHYLDRMCMEVEAMNGFTFSPALGWVAGGLLAAGLAVLAILEIVLFVRRRASSDETAWACIRRTLMLLIVAVMVLTPSVVSSTTSQAINATDVIVAVDTTGSMAVADATYGSEKTITRIDARTSGRA